MKTKKVVYANWYGIRSKHTDSNIYFKVKQLMRFEAKSIKLITLDSIIGRFEYHLN